ncbi:MAG: uroporphyrinogen decarboxylase family protein [Planctomycetota bacterium]
MAYHMDFQRHNEEVRALWAGYREGKPTRVPVQWHMNSRMWLLNPRLNTKGYTFQDYYRRPEVALEVELEFTKWRRTEVMEDTHKGLPEKWHVNMCGQNVLGAGWLGSKIVFRENAVPHVEPGLLAEKDALKDAEIPDVRARDMRYAWEFRDYCLDQIKKGYEFEGRPLAGVGYPGVEPPMTLAYLLRGSTQFLIDLCEDADYFRRLMTYATDAYLTFTRKVHEWQGVKEKPRQGGFSDDAIELISVAHFNEFVYPHHKRVLDALYDGGPFCYHLCGRAQHQFRNLRDRLNVWAFDTGFPTDLGKARKELGPAVTLWGNIHVATLQYGTKDEITDAVRKILDSGVMHGGRFVFGDGNNVAERTPEENLNHCYEVVKDLGAYRQDQYVEHLEPKYYPYAG